MHLVKVFFLLLVFVTNISLAQQKKIAYCSNQGTSEFLQVFIMDEDGSDKKQLTDLQENCMRPKWSPDGKQIVFYSDRGFIYLIRDIENNTSRPFYLWSGYNPSFMPGGDQVMFNHEQDEVLSIFIIDTNAYGAEPSLLSDGGYSNMQVVSNDGDKLVYSTFQNDVKVIMAADLNDTTDNYEMKISQNDDANLEPDISPDEKRITYASFDNNLKGTIRIHENGVEKELSRGLPSSNVPRFSPDGSTIAFVVIDSKVDLYVMDPDGSDRKNSNVDGGSVGTFQWIDNDRIIYDAGTDIRVSVGIVNIKTGASNIIADGGFNLHPSIQK